VKADTLADDKRFLFGQLTTDNKLQVQIYISYADMECNQRQTKSIFV